MFAVEHPLDLPLAKREQERNIKSLLLIEKDKGLKDHHRVSGVQSKYFFRITGRVEAGYPLQTYY
jgi:hypothetical protein